jgi:prevent-host-death family protein
MATVTIHEAKTQLSKLIARAEAGEEIVIARGKQPVVRLAPIAAKKPRPRFGMMKGKWPDLPDSFWFDPLPEEELRLWEGEGHDEDPAR